MRIYCRCCFHILLFFICLLLFYFAKNIYDIWDSSDKDFEKQTGDIYPTDQLKGADKGIPELHFEEEDVNKPRNNNKIHGPQNVGISAVIERLHHRKRSSVIKNFTQRKRASKRLKLPPFVNESREDGLGEHGRKATLHLNLEEEKESKRLFGLNEFNQYLSDRISVHRRLGDARTQACRDLMYHKNLPMVSVIICFHNEAWSTLLRSVHSIIDRSPPHLLREIILVDDFSTMDHLKGPLEQFLDDLPKVKIIRASKQGGLIRARLLGYEVAAGPVLVFLDSHIECFPGWLEPLVARISEDSKAVVFPNIPAIQRDTFAVYITDTSLVGSFSWNGLFFTWKRMPIKEARDTDPISDHIGNGSYQDPFPMRYLRYNCRKLIVVFNIYDPFPDLFESFMKQAPGRTACCPIFRSPTMPGGLFAIDKKWFTTLGTYDPGLEFWGGENMELSFKSWMCNGSIEKIPCSHVGHIYRNTNPTKWHTSGVIERNSMRVAEVWMDEYKEIFYDYSFSKSDFGDVSDRLRLRDSLQCHDFKWYLDNVFQGDVPPSVIASGEIRSAVAPYCVDSMNSEEDPQLYRCHGGGLAQRWVITETNKIMQGTWKNLCFISSRLQLYGCRNSDTVWKINYKTGTLQHKGTGWCLELRIPKTLGMGRCNGAKYQKWILPARKTG